MKGRTSFTTHLSSVELSSYVAQLSLLLSNSIVGIRDASLEDNNVGTRCRQLIGGRAQNAKFIDELSTLNLDFGQLLQKLSLHLLSCALLKYLLDAQ